jgi:3-oxoacyl-[acyl-carrier-protein] synthase III
MDIAHISAAIGDCDQDLDEIDRALQTGTDGGLRRMLVTSLKATGFRRRFKSSKPDLLRRAFAPMAELKDKIQYVIGVSLIRDYLGPAMASFYCRELGLREAQTFDVLQGCLGVVRALQVAQGLFETGQVHEDRYVLIISHEVLLTGEENMSCFDLSLSTTNPDWQTKGISGCAKSDASTAILLKASPNRSWSFCFVNDNTAAAGAGVRLLEPGGGLFRQLQDTEVNALPRMKYYSLPSLKEAFEGNFRRMLPSIESDIREADRLYVHAFSQRFWKNLLAPLGLAKKPFDIYPSHGNVLTSSLPLSLFLDLGSTIPPGKKICYLGAGAGGGTCALTFTSGE